MILEETFLVNGLRGKNKGVFDLVFTYYYSGLCVFVNRYVNDTEAAEDIVQDLFVRLWHNSFDLQIESSLKSYLFACARNKALDFLKHQKVKGRHKRKLMQQSEVVTPDEMWEFAETELRDILTDAMAKLPPRTREIFEMSRFHGLSNDQISIGLDISKRTVEVQISNALKILRKELKDFLPLLLLL